MRHQRKPLLRKGGSLIASNPIDGGTMVSMRGRPLFNNPIERSDIKQGYMYDCFSLVTLSGDIEMHPAWTGERIKQIDPDHVSVKLCEPTYNYMGVVQYYTEFDVVVDMYVPASIAGVAAEGSYIALFEKALCWMLGGRYGDNSYNVLMHGGNPTTVMTMLGYYTGILPSTFDRQYLNAIQQIRNRKDFVTCITKSTLPAPYTILQNHCLSIVDAVYHANLGDIYWLHNPWAIDGYPNDSDPNDGLFWLRADEMKQIIVETEFTKGIYWKPTGHSGTAPILPPINVPPPEIPILP